jgi:flavin-dependent dehydrogenase
VVLERARFPRAKPCAECLSPQASRLLADIGALRDIEARGAWLHGMIVRSPDGVVARGDYAADHGFRAYRDAGLSIRREILDDVLQRRARDAGAEIVEGARVTGMVSDHAGRVRGVTALGPAGDTGLRADMIVGADGLRSVVARRLRLSRTSRWPSRIALVAHYRAVGDVSTHVEMHIERDGFVGIADVGGGVTTVSAVFPRQRARAFAGNPGAFLDQWLSSKPHLAPRFRHAIRERVVSAVGPFASHARSARHAAGGAVLVGDAADFFDPFTGEGIYAALRGGELAADAIARALGASDALAGEALRDYDDARRREFGGKWWVERLIGIGVASGAVANRAIRAMAARKELADLLVGVTGDFIPAHHVLRLGYLAQLFVVPLPSTPLPAWR